MHEEFKKIISYHQFENNVAAQQNILMDTVEWLCIMSWKSRQEGLLALEAECEELEAHERNILRVGMQLVIDGTDACNIKKYFKNRIRNARSKFEELMFRIIKTGLLSIQCGNNTRIMVLLIDSVIPDNMRKDNFIKDLFAKLELN